MTHLQRCMTRRHCQKITYTILYPYTNILKIIPNSLAVMFLRLMDSSRSLFDSLALGSEEAVSGPPRPAMKTKRKVRSEGS